MTDYFSPRSLVSEFFPSVFDPEFEVDRYLGPILSSIPCASLLAQRLKGVDATPAKALLTNDANLDVSSIQPARVFRRGVDREARQQFFGFLLAKCMLERSDGVRV